MIKLLFVCSANRLRSPTAERIFSGREGLEVLSAGIAADAQQPLTADLVEWADVIFVMEKSQMNRLRKRFKAHLQRTRLVCLNIPDEYDFMDPVLVQLLNAAVPRYLPEVSG